MNGPKKKRKKKETEIKLMVNHHIDAISLRSYITKWQNVTVDMKATNQEAQDEIADR